MIKERIMMEELNDSLSTFLTEYRENALRDLQEHEVYIKLIEQESQLRERINEMISPEAQMLLIDYTETISEIQGLEYNRIMLCGLTAMEEIRKRFDPVSPEYRAFASEYLK